MPDFEKEALQRRLNSDRKTVKAQLTSELKNLAMRTERALEALKSEDGLDAHLIVNASSISGLIERWNLIRDLTPYIEAL